MIRAFLLVLALVLALGNIASASGLSSARQVLERLGFAPTELEEVLDGQFAQRAGKSDTDSDIAVALAFLVRTPPVKFDRELTGKRFVFSLDPHTLGGDEIPGNGSLGDFAGLTLSAAERNFYALPEGEEFSYFKWTEKIYIPPQQELFLFADFKKVGGIIIISYQALDPNRYPNAKLWQTFDDFNLKNENYYIYTFQK